MTNILYSAVPIDRAHRLRRDPGALAALAASPERLVVPLWQELSLIAGDRGVVLSGQAAALAMELAETTAFLGLWGGHPVFVADIAAAEPDRSPPALGLEGQWLPLRLHGPALPHAEGGLLAYGRALLAWHRRARFCPVCGAPTESRDGGFLRVCQDERCAAQSYPRTDPAVIMRIDDGAGRVLLHRQHAWPAGMWSVLAGFVEPGESLEEAVAREVLEETGIAVAEIAYVASQPWPFPSSLMIGFTGRAVGGTLEADPDEIEDAAWFSREDIRARFDDRHRETGSGLFLPRAGTLARVLLDDWLLTTASA
ncbi:NAD(+) diphosphatase [Magnetospirillum sp. UT-4]|uniref:NAD(+) diphosphatase n=1 Tax=Magnetospirillum sp. UT-4 TaxID=2681467 RepID=UPI0013830E06|nr:NAD(+) diphosphatase [Magnetospirillum sp. UT-4]CAA7625531.1 NADH pyrophosphatase [Magnetospirillum sp. UT-4]